jgi:hypothetical protein
LQVFRQASAKKAWSGSADKLSKGRTAAAGRPSKPGTVSVAFSFAVASTDSDAGVAEPETEVVRNYERPPATTANDREWRLRKRQG